MTHQHNGGVSDDALIERLGRAIHNDAAVACAADPILREHLRPSRGYREIGVDVRLHKNVFYPIQTALALRCGFSVRRALAVARVLRRDHNKDRFYNGPLENATEFRASLTTFWPQLREAATACPPLESGIANAICEEALAWSRKVCEEQGLSLVNTIEVGGDVNIYRGRADRDDSLSELVARSPELTLGATPPEQARAHRLSRNGESCFYGATSIENCLSELRLQNGERGSCPLKWCNTSALSL